MKNINELILFLIFLLLSVSLNTVGAKHLISKKKLEEKDTKTKAEKIIFTVLSVAFTGATTAFLIYSEKSMPMLVILCMIAVLAGMIFLMDIRVRIIPNVCLYPILLLAVIRYIVLKNYVGIGSGFVAMFFACYGLLLLTRLLGFNGCFGSGDIKLLSVCVFFFGIDRNIIGFVAGWVISLFATTIVLLLMKKITMKSFIAYGPYISIGIFTGLCFMYI